jgi:predicted MFS family arabinose efflux permease
VSAFSIVFATGIGTGTLAGLVGGYLPDFIKAMGGTSHLVDDIRIVLIIACALVVIGIWPILHLDLGHVERTTGRALRLFHPFLFRFLPPFAIWSIVTGSFTPFAAIYLQQQLKLPLGHVGLVFSASQLAQFAAVLLAPLIYRRFGTIAGIACIQIATGLAVFSLGHTHAIPIAIACYLGFSGLQFMSGPGIYSLFMTRLPDEERSAASAVQNIVGALFQAGAAAVTGVTIVRFGYSVIFSANAVFAAAAAVLLTVLISRPTRQTTQV